MYKAKILLHRYFLRTFLRCSEHRCGTPLNGCFQNSLPGISNFLLRFVRVICRKFKSLCEGGNTLQRHSASWYPLSFLHLFQFYLILPFLLPPNLNSFSASIFSEISIHFVLKICGMFISNF